MSDDDLTRRRVLQGIGITGVVGVTGYGQVTNGTHFGNATVRTEREVPEDDHGDRCPPVEYNLNTGYDQTDDELIPAGSKDDDWDVTGDEKNGAGTVPRDADVVGSNSWPTTFQDSQWISFEPDSGRRLPEEDTQYEYTYCFCLNEGYRNPELTLTLQADDLVEDIRLNGNPLPFSGDGDFQGAPIEETYTSRRYFQPGENCLTVVVRDTQQVVSGVNLVGQMRAENADCDCGCGGCDLSVEKHHEGQFAFGETGTYVVEVCNDGDGECTRAAVVEDELPDGVAFASASGNDWRVSVDNGTITAVHPNPGGLAPGECLPPLVVEVEIAPFEEFPTDIELLRNCADLLGSDEDAANDTGCDEIRCLEGKHAVQGGADDEFAGGNTEATSPSQGLQERIDLPIRDFDESGINKPFAHTFEVPQPPLAGDICEATLSFRARPNGANDNNDFLSLGLWHDDGTKDEEYSWSQSMGERNTPGIFPVQWSENQTGAHETTLDLSDLYNHSQPNADLVSYLRQHGRLDVMIHDDTEVDYMDLAVTYCCGDGTEECTLSVEKTVEEPFRLGDTGTYVIEVCNDGEVPCEEGPINVTDELPDGITLARAGGNGWGISQRNGTLVAEHPNTDGLEPGECLPALYIEVEVPEEYPATDEIRNCVRLFVDDRATAEDCVQHTVTQRER
ncbi:DUF11 domain-containing protein (plasmid) [Haloferax mediterranei ATCC 33500]|uniref:DUF11 domain-containing protein n=1 Tax=Haloferax mediterranei (strain ATCC 33500 / DSM 1411 / JCM 8866 / NBRC 14739 / NCIMB 2177 / R-4) TaxID=523841 RepID=I3RA16_HALMT|nr:DUF11 domain-containing protein [Haloferax mediterranei]AFK21076.1 hypothetical protein HFX_5244 [Haloferax mediterranei ATCC 33500]AHZ24068.1 hypothetical protein BM92_17830 [Haloferax mediterranei ATCC 33500]EMA05141.1 hypothetical protein C439_00040 [Haloferax mediterranei ATCC 33500]MDX5989782.1 DUF11 domain-containing protein [Haloferax mediterranei ATCC 33500]QCQ77226.1 DUF11 domain-containing protein [Haloferax mediterranei ATCC 33500]